jgi:nitroimidazol reductase NimA-like FMN-containing flavoprotein (pyridoxamine 5'-phosphate oxidase superfamily)
MRKMTDQGTDEILAYITATKFGVLNYVRSDLAPVARAMGSFASDGLDIYFSTGRDSAKVGEIALNKRVSFYFQHDNQAAETWKSVLVIGDAELLNSDDAGFDTAVSSLSAKSPRFRARVENGDLASAAVYRLVTREIQFLDRSTGYGPPRIVVVS